MTPDFHIALDGQTIDLASRLISLEISDYADTDSDTLNLVLADSDNSLELPRRGVELTAAIGFKETGLIDKGLFTVDEVEYSSPPNTLTISARAANFRGSFRQRREASYHETTLGKILDTLANRNDLSLNIHPNLETIAIDHIDQTEADSAFMYRLAKRYDATATIKEKRMVIMPKAEAQSLSGAPLPAVNITENQCTSWRLTIADRGSNISGVSAKWLSDERGNTFTVTAGEKSNSQMLSKTYPTKSEALAAAAGELKRRKRAGMSIDVQLATGNPNIIAESPIKLTDFKGEIDGTGWIATEVRHSLNNQGLMTSLKIEQA